MDDKVIKAAMVQINNMTRKEAQIFLLGFGCAERLNKNNDEKSCTEIMRAAKERVENNNAQPHHERDSYWHDLEFPEEEEYADSGEDGA